MLTFRASSSVEVVGRECRGAEDKQASNRCRVDAMGISVVYYLLTVAFAWATSYGAFKQQVPALNIWPACRVQGMGMGDGRRGALATRRVHCQAHYLTLGTIRRSLKTDNTSSQDRSASRYPYSPMCCQLHMFSGTQRLFSAFPIIECVSARLDHLNLGCASPIA